MHFTLNVRIYKNKDNKCTLTFCRMSSNIDHSEWLQFSDAHLFVGVCKVSMTVLLKEYKL